MARKYHRIISTLAVGGLLAAFAPGAYAASVLNSALNTKHSMKVFGAAFGTMNLMVAA